MFTKLQVLPFLDACQRLYIPHQHGMKIYGTSSYNTWAAKILHKDYNGYFNIETVFLNPKLIKVSMVLSQTYGSQLIVLVTLCNNLWTKCCSETFQTEPLIHKLKKQHYGTSLGFD